jgi:hypothetical protein
MRYQKNIRKTMKYAKKGLNLWLKTFIHTFVMVHKGMSCLNFEDFASSPQSNETKKNEVGSLQAPRSTTITNWPKFTFFPKLMKFGPIQSHVLGD